MTTSSNTDRRISIEQIDALLPQTQCGLCKHPGCRPYAEAMLAGEDINHCVPGGAPTIHALSQLLNKPAKPLDPDYGVTPEHRLVALIREDECIGCTKCIQACPVDAIVGAGKLMHTVIVDECTGCNLCVPPCPVDCIDLVPGPDIPMTWHPPTKPGQDLAKAKAEHARQRYLARNKRLAKTTAPAPAKSAAPVSAAQPDQASLMISAAMARSQLKKIQKQIQALQAQQADCSHLLTQLPELEQRVKEAEAALNAAT
ncbi:MAG: electron transport complex subunit RsxB [Moraxellaceae bacterium]|nr:electron transport complex subunit RsxB [Moraxellaceae bacterium]